MPVKPKVLVVVADPGVRRRVLEALMESEAEACCLSGGREAVRLLEREKFDGIFLDWAISDIAASELVGHIRASRLNYAVPIIALASETERQVITESFKQGVTLFFGEPLTRGKLQRLLAVSRGLILEERRQSQRAEVALPIECRHEQDEETGTSIDLSARGVRAKIEKVYPAEANLQLRFQLPTKPEVTVRGPGQVVRVTRGKEMGIRFLWLSPKERKLIADFVEKLLEEQ